MLAPRSTSAAGPPQAYAPLPGELPCGCCFECDCPPYALSAALFSAVASIVLTSPALLTGVSFGDGYSDPDLRRILAVTLGVALVLAALQFAVCVLALLAAALGDRDHAAARIWRVARVLLAALLGTAVGVVAVLLLWAVLSSGSIGGIVFERLWPAGW